MLVIPPAGGCASSPYSKRCGVAKLNLKLDARGQAQSTTSIHHHPVPAGVLGRIERAIGGLDLTQTDRPHGSKMQGHFRIDNSCSKFGESLRCPAPHDTLSHGRAPPRLILNRLRES